jgi:hypothetical protein
MSTREQKIAVPKGVIAGSKAEAVKVPEQEPDGSDYFQTVINYFKECTFKAGFFHVEDRTYEKLPVFSRQRRSNGWDADERDWIVMTTDIGRTIMHMSRQKVLMGYTDHHRDNQLVQLQVYVLSYPQISPSQEIARHNKILSNKIRTLEFERAKEKENYTLEIQLLSEKNDELSTALLNAQQQVDAQANDVSNQLLMESKQQLEQQLADVDAERLNLETQLNQYMEHSAATEAAYNSQKVEVESLEGQLVGYQDIIESLKQQMSDLAVRNDEVSNARDLLPDPATDINDTDSAAQIESLNRELAQHIVTEEVLRQQIITLQAQLSEHADLDDSYNKEITRLQDLVAEKTDQLAQWEAKLVEVEGFDC